MFYAPRWLWKHWEGGKIHALMLDMDIGVCTEAEKNQKKKILLNYLWENLRYHNWWAYRYYLCELLAFLNVVGKLYNIFFVSNNDWIIFSLCIVFINEIYTFLKSIF